MTACNPLRAAALICGLLCLTEAWAPPSALGVSNRCKADLPSTTALFYSLGDQSNSTTTPAILERLKINGVSVSPKGFHVLLESTTMPQDRKQENEGSVVLPLKMTNDPADAYAATSPESLTLCQLLSGVDMAGAILPPELLGRIVLSHIEDKLESMYDDDDDEGDSSEGQFTPVLSPIESKLWEHLQNQEALLREQKLFSPPGTTPSQTPIPQATLDQLTLVPNQSEETGQPSWLCRLECALPEWKDKIVVDVKSDLLASLSYNYDPEASPLFTCIALALRYKAPIVLLDKDEATPVSHEYWSSKDDLDRDFPQRLGLGSLREQSNRVTENIEKGFEIHKLTGALQIALRLGDAQAAAKIRAKLDEYDSMDDLPTTTTTENDEDDPLDDLEQNILQ